MIRITHASGTYEQVESTLPCWLGPCLRTTVGARRGETVQIQGDGERITVRVEDESAPVLPPPIATMTPAERADFRDAINALPAGADGTPWAVKEEP